MSKTSTIYAQGLRFFNARETAPDFVKGTVVVNLKQFFDFMGSKEVQDHYTKFEGNNQVKLNMLSGDKGIYFTVDTFKPTASKQETVAVESSSDLSF